MSASVITFYILCAVIITGAWMAVTDTKIFRAAIFLLFSLIGIAGLYFFLDYQFLGAVQIVVYAGGIVVLIIFSILLTAQSGSDMKRPKTRRLIFSALSSVLCFALVLFIIRSAPFQASDTGSIAPTTANIGRQMLSTTEHGYILPFEVISILLLAAMIGCIVIAIKPKKETA
jgi:NADH-quinone oxidoreductase subunit J